MGVGRGAAWLFGLALVLGVAASAEAQEAVVASPILVIDQNRLFVESAFGKASIARERAFLAELEEENKRIEAELVAEEQALTDLRSGLSAEEFSARAKAFDAKVVAIRTEQDSKAAGLNAQRDADRQTFVTAIGPIVAELLTERQAVAIVDKGLVILSLSAIDVTDAAIAKVDAALKETAAETTAP